MCCNVEPPAGTDAYMEKAKIIYTHCANEGGLDIPKIVECIARKFNMVRNQNLESGVDVEFLWILFYSSALTQIDDAGNLSEAGMKFLFNEIPLSEYHRTVKDASITVCIAKNKATPVGDLIEKLQKFNRCMLKDFANACPKDKQEDSDKCKKYRKGRFLLIRRWCSVCIGLELIWTIKYITIAGTHVSIEIFDSFSDSDLNVTNLTRSTLRQNKSILYALQL